MCSLIRAHVCGWDATWASLLEIANANLSMSDSGFTHDPTAAAMGEMRGARRARSALLTEFWLTVLFAPPSQAAAPGSEGSASAANVAWYDDARRRKLVDAIAQASFYAGAREELAFVRSGGRQSRGSTSSGRDVLRRMLVLENQRMRTAATESSTGGGSGGGGLFASVMSWVNPKVAPCRSLLNDGSGAVRGLASGLRKRASPHQPPVNAESSASALALDAYDAVDPATWDADSVLGVIDVRCPFLAYEVLLLETAMEVGVRANASRWLGEHPAAQLESMCGKGSGVATSQSLLHFVIYRWCHVAMSLPPLHPLLPLVWQVGVLGSQWFAGAN